MSKKEPLKSAYVWRPCDAAWKLLEEKADKDRRPINQVLNDIVLDYFTPKLFDNVSGVRPQPEIAKKVAKRNTATKKAKPKKQNAL
jgi:hypothetical protein